MQSKWLLYTVSITVVLALCVVMLGAYTRLTNAGLGCPDWPGCYGHMVLPAGDKAFNSAQRQFPDSPIEVKKAWTEMTHRYLAGTLALLIFVTGFALIARHFKDRESMTRIPLQLPITLMVLVIFQAALGMWTVTMKLLPVVVMGHLLGGILVFSLLSRLRLQMSEVKPANLPSWRLWVGLAVVILFCQIALGGWVSANYAGIACVGFPQCNGLWMPRLHLSEGFNLFSPAGVNYQGGALDTDARVSIQFIHRIGAIITAGYIISLSTLLLRRVTNRAMRTVVWTALLLVVTQFLLGVMNVMYLLPIKIAVAHNGVAAMLMATILMMLYLTKKEGTV